MRPYKVVLEISEFWADENVNERGIYKILKEENFSCYDKDPKVKLTFTPVEIEENEIM